MILILNGGFGVGKTTVGRLLRRRIIGSRLYNPEWAGSLLMRLPTSIELAGSGTDDFQDIDIWRRSVVRGTGIFRTLSGGTVIVPMALKRRDYFDEIIGGMREIEGEIRVFCLKAGMPTILNRLKQRKATPEEGKWTVLKAKECVEAHSDVHFGDPINTEEITAVEVVKEILTRLDIPDKFSNRRPYRK